MVVVGRERRGEEEERSWRLLKGRDGGSCFALV
jgi:hypothetical protein